MLNQVKPKSITTDTQTDVQKDIIQKDIQTDTAQTDVQIGSLKSSSPIRAWESEMFEHKWDDLLLGPSLTHRDEKVHGALVGDHPKESIMEETTID